MKRNIHAEMFHGKSVKDRKILRNNTKCCVQGCNNTSLNNSNLSFHLVPPSKRDFLLITSEDNSEHLIDVRDLWIDKLKIGRNIKKAHVCSNHFAPEDFATLVSLIERNKFTYVVEIVDSTHADGIHCGGAIIDETHILTAAHCVFYSLKEKITIHAGEVHRGSVWGKMSSVARIHVTKKFRDHESRCGIWDRIRGWVRDAWDHIKDEANCYLFQDDVAVLTLSEALPFNENITAVNLPDYDLLPHCQLCIFPGWGQTEKDGGPSQNLQWIYLMISETPRNRMKFSRAFWAMDPMLKTCPLMGDSGAPLVFNNTVYGVHSAGNRDPSIPSIFCKVFAHINFIREALKN